jgi:Rubredoxin
MKKYLCTICGYIYDEEKGYPECGVAKDMFEIVE